MRNQIVGGVDKSFSEFDTRASRSLNGRGGYPRSKKYTARLHVDGLGSLVWAESIPQDGWLAQLELSTSIKPAHHLIFGAIDTLIALLSVPRVEKKTKCSPNIGSPGILRMRWQSTSVQAAASFFAFGGSLPWVRCSCHCQTPRHSLGHWELDVT